LSSSSSSSDRDDPSGAAAEETESENAEAAAAEEIESEGTEAAAAEAVSGADDFTADISSADIGSLDIDAIINASSEEKDVEAGASTEDDEVSMDELGAAGAASDSDSTASASKPKSAEGATEEHGTAGVVTGAEKVIEITSIAITSSGGTAQGGPSGSGSHVDPPLVDSSPSTRQYVRRARRGSLVSSDSERTASASARVATPPSPPPKSGGTVPLSTVTVAGVSAAATVSESGVVPTTIKETPVGVEGSAHVSDVPEGSYFIEGIPIDENLVIDTGFDAGVIHVEPAEVAVSAEPVQADVTLGSGVPVIEEELAQDPADDIDMGDTHDSYDEVLAETEDNIAGAQAAAHTSPTKTGIGF
jgi:hypothetical protein